MTKLTERDLCPVSKEAVEKAGKDYGTKVVVGTGPFKFVQLKQNCRACCERASSAEAAAKISCFFSLVIIQTSPPDRYGFMSYGVAVDVELAARGRHREAPATHRQIAAALPRAGLGIDLPQVAGLEQSIDPAADLGATPHARRTIAPHHASDAPAATFPR